MTHNGASTFSAPPAGSGAPFVLSVKGERGASVVLRLRERVRTEHIPLVGYE